MPPLPLADVRVLDLTMVWAGPFATRLLADLGAEVVKVEAIQLYDISRGSASPTGPGIYPDNDPGPRPWNRRGFFHLWNRNKWGLTLDLRHRLGIKLLRELVKISDVVIENFSPRVMPNLGLDYERLREIRPDLIMLSMPAYGAAGPERDYISFGAGQEQTAGLAAITGYPGETPLKSGLDYGDPTAGWTAAGLILAALRHRARTGQGQWIDLAQSEATSLLIGEVLLDYAVNGRIWEPRGNDHSSMAPHGAYPCAGQDRWLAIAVGTDAQWRALHHVMGDPAWAADPAYATVLGRYRARRQLDPQLAAWTRTQDRDDLQARLQAAGVPAGAAQTAPDLLADPQLAAREFYQPISHPEVGTHPYPGVAFRLHRTPGEIHRLGPSLGEHNRWVLAELLGLDGGAIGWLAAEEVIGTVPLPGADRL